MPTCKSKFQTFWLFFLVTLIRETGVRRNGWCGCDFSHPLLWISAAAYLESVSAGRALRTLHWRLQIQQKSGLNHGTFSEVAEMTGRALPRGRALAAGAGALRPGRPVQRVWPHLGRELRLRLGAGWGQQRGPSCPCEKRKVWEQRHPEAPCGGEGGPSPAEHGSPRPRVTPELEEAGRAMSGAFRACPLLGLELVSSRMERERISAVRRHPAAAGSPPRPRGLFRSENICTLRARGGQVSVSRPRPGLP